MSFKCAKCGSPKGTQGEKPTKMVTVIRPVEYRRKIEGANGQVIKVEKVSVGTEIAREQDFHPKCALKVKIKTVDSEVRYVE